MLGLLKMGGVLLFGLLKMGSVLVLLLKIGGVLMSGTVEDWGCFNVWDC